jgi:hypothetical protein
VVAEDGDDRHLQPAAGVGEDGRFLGIAARRQVAGEEDEVGAALERGERPHDSLAVYRRSVHVARGCDADRPSVSHG